MAPNDAAGIFGTSKIKSYKRHRSICRACVSLGNGLNGDTRESLDKMIIFTVTELMRMIKSRTSQEVQGVSYRGTVRERISRLSKYSSVFQCPLTSQTRRQQQSDLSTSMTAEEFLNNPVESRQISDKQVATSLTIFIYS